MRRQLPCKKCGSARLSKDKPYIVGSVPMRLQQIGGVLTVHCDCGTLTTINRAQFNALPNIKEPDAQS